MFAKSRGVVAAVAAAVAWVSCAQSVHAAEEDDAVIDPRLIAGGPLLAAYRAYYLTREIFSGADAGLDASSLYTGTTIAPFGLLRSNGLRLRSTVGYGTYRYTSLQWDGAQRHNVAFTGQHATVDVLAGWQHAFGPWVVKAFAGGTIVGHATTPFDVDNGVAGEHLGVKVALEPWLALGDWGYVQSDLAWSTPFSTHSARVRGGVRLHPAWSVGLEGSIFGIVDHQTARAGVFGRVEATFGELSVSGGLSNDPKSNASPYATAALLWRF